MKSPSAQSLAHPRQWPTWFGVALLRAASALPLPLLWFIGGALGSFLYLVHFPRRRVVAINIRLCFPHWSPARRAFIGWGHFCALGQALFDVGVAWWASPRRLRRLVRVRNPEYLTQALAGGKGLIMLAPHFVAMEVGGMYLSLSHAGATYYKKTKNPVVNYLFVRRRPRFGGVALEQAVGLKPAVRAVQAGNLFYYLPDQDLGRKLSVFAPFFGVPTATVPALGKLARLSGAAVLPCVTRQRAFGRGYEVIFYPPLTAFPSGDELSDTAQMNRAIEQAVVDMPAQYFWVHKRFKTRPEGAPKIY